MDPKVISLLAGNFLLSSTILLLEKIDYKEITEIKKKVEKLTNEKIPDNEFLKIIHELMENNLIDIKGVEIDLGTSITLSLLGKEASNLIKNSYFNAYSINEDRLREIAK